MSSISPAYIPDGHDGQKNDDDKETRIDAETRDAISPAYIPADDEETSPAYHLVAKLKEFNAAPGVIGFGISSPEQVKAALATGAIIL